MIENIHFPKLPREQLLVSLAGPTLSILIDKMKNKKVGLIEVCFKYTAGVLCSYLAYTMGAELRLVAIISIASSDIVKYIASEDGWNLIKDFLINFLSGGKQK